MIKPLQKNENCLSDEVRKEIIRLHNLGFQLLPLGGEDGKRPSIKNWSQKPPSLGQNLAILFSQNSNCYGVRLSGLVVLDCDIDDPKLVADLEQRFGHATVKIATSRGVHLYYQQGSAIPKLRSEGLPVDVKSGPSAYVVGPNAQRPDGALYRPLEGVLGQTELNPIRVESQSTTMPLRSMHSTGKVVVGKRHNHLFARGIAMVASVDKAEELTENLRFERDEFCDAPETISENELVNIANWCWEKRLSNQLFHGRNSSFQVARQAVDALGNERNASDAIALYTRLTDLHGHTPGKVFRLNYSSMREAKQTDLSRDRFRAARRTLESNGLLRVVQKHSPKKIGCGYQLTNPLVCEQTTYLGPAKQTKATAKNRQKGSIVTLDDGKPSQPNTTLKRNKAER